MKRGLLIAACLIAVFSTISAKPALAATTNYALGDSRASGYGLAPLPNATQDDNNCGRSSQAYSAVAAAQVGAVNTNFACAGATLYGVYDQIERAKTYGSPNFVTLTDGANDTNWGQWINDCMTLTNCGGTAKETAFQNTLTTYKTNLKTILTKITTDLKPGQILVAGYGPLFGTNTSCAAARGITSSEVTTIERRIAAIDKTMSDVSASVPSATYVAITFGGQGICTPNGPILPFSSPYSAHPTPMGHQIIANAVLAKVK